MPFRRRPLMAATIVGGAAYAGSKAGAQKGAANAQAAPQPQAAAQPAPVAAAPAAVAPPVEAPAALPVEPSADEKMDQLAKLKQLLDIDAITKDEYDAQKTRILASM